MDIKYRDGVAAYDEAAQRGEAELASMGFPPAERPLFDDKFGNRPTMPTQLSTLSMADLQDLMGLFTAWHSYALEVFPQVAADRNAASSKKDFAWASIRGEKKGKTSKDKDDETRIDGRYVEINAAYEVLDYKYRRISAVCKGLEREIETISRAQSALEQRGGTHSKEVSSARAVVRASAFNSFRTKRKAYR